VVGAGANTRQKHIPGFRACAGVEVTAVVNRTRASSEAVARAEGIPRVMDHWRDLVAGDEIDAVCIGTWPYLHAEIAIAALRAGKHVLTEARMAASLAEAEAMERARVEAAVAKPGIVAQIVPSPMTLPWDETVAELLTDGALGRLTDVAITHLHGAYVNPQTPIAWRQRRELNGVNTLTLGIYYEAVQRWLGEDATVIAAQAGIVTGERADETGARVAVDVPDWVRVDGVFANGARLRCELSAVETRSPRNEITVTGERGALHLDLAAGRLRMRTDGGDWREVEVATQRRGEWRVEADFVESIRTGEPVRLTDFPTGVRYMRFTEAAWTAWQR